jgi:hypothetical protein
MCGNRYLHVLCLLLPIILSMGLGFVSTFQFSLFFMSLCLRRASIPVPFPCELVAGSCWFGGCRSVLSSVSGGDKAVRQEMCHSVRVLCLYLVRVVVMC